MGIEKVAPQILQSHDISATNVEECITAMGNDVPILFETFHTLLPYVDEVLEWDWQTAYENYAKILQILEYLDLKDKPSGTKPKRWVLKSPLHLWKLNDLFKIFPDADTTWAHRKQEKVIFSFSDMMRANSDFLMDDVIDLYGIGGGVLHYAEKVMRKGDDFLKEKDTKIKLEHVRYESFIRDPIATVKQIYYQLGYEFTDEYLAILEKHIADDNVKRSELRKKDNRIPATLETYGVTDKMIEERLGWYEKKYVSEANGVNGH